MHDEPWQVFAENGEPIDGLSYRKADFPTDAIMGAAHIWLWRRGDAGIAVMLQKRASNLSSWPGYYDISAAGHIDENETPLKSAVRETAEEIGLDADIGRFKFAFTSRTPLAKYEIDFVYLYEVSEEFVATFDDGEVELVEWVSLDDFAVRTKDPEDYNLLNQGEHYFGLLIDQLNRL